jgi:fluoride exporter
MNMVLAVACGGAFGSVLRYLAVSGWTKMLGDAFPYGTLFVNVLGGFLIGLIVEGAALKWDMPLETRALLVTGVLGGFTTFSAFSMDTFKLIETGRIDVAAFYVLSSVILSVSAVYGGVYLVKELL